MLYCLVRSKAAIFAQHEFYKLHYEPKIVKVIKAGTLRWLGYLCRTHGEDPCRHVAFHKKGDIT